MVRTFDMPLTTSNCFSYFTILQFSPSVFCYKHWLLAMSYFLCIPLTRRDSRLVYTSLFLFIYVFDVLFGVHIWLVLSITISTHQKISKESDCIYSWLVCKYISAMIDSSQLLLNVSIICLVLVFGAK